MTRSEIVLLEDILESIEKIDAYLAGVSRAEFFEEFRRYWRDAHGPIAAKLPGLRKYLQNHALPGPDGTDPPFDGLTEVWFDDTESFLQAVESPEGTAAFEDAANFQDMEGLPNFMVEEIVVV